MSKEPLLKVSHLKKFFPIRGGLFGRKLGQVHAVDDVSFQLFNGQTLGIVGESGCGKSTLGRTLLRLYEPSSGSIIFQGQELSTLSGRALRALRPDMQMIFQDPYSSLNPRMTIGSIISEPLIIHRICSKDEVESRVKSLLEVVGLNEGSFDRYPHEFSGGQRQRIGIARALALAPKLIVADEPVSALDVSIQSQILNLLVELKNKYQLSYVFIAHDLAVIEHISDFVAVMYLGKIVEYASSDSLYKKPTHPYTRVLMDSIPIAVYDKERRKRKAELISGDVPSPISPPSGCHFHPRCPKATQLCREKYPVSKNIGSEDDPHLVSCHHI